MRLREFDEKERLLKANEKLTHYKTAAGADAAAADASGNFARGHKRFKGINAATKKQFDNDAKLSQLKEFAPGSGGGESGRWYTDDQITDLVGDGWYQDLDVSGDIPKQQMIQQAQAWLDDQGYSVEVLNCRVNDDDMEWYIEGTFYNPDFAKKGVAEEWSQKYKNSINCSHPKGFSQRAHCAGKKKHNESIEMEMVCEDCGMCQTHGSLNEIKKGEKDSNGYTRCWPGRHAEGTKTGKNGGQVRNCEPNESIEESDKSDDRCQQCGMINCKCPGDNCKCKPIAGWIPNKGFRKAAEQSVAEDSLAAMRRLAGVSTPAPVSVPNGQRQYRHMPTAVQPR